ncbi:MAG: class I adenylate-forming enzyme family protein [Vicinamibacterales bacterium]
MTSPAHVVEVLFARAADTPQALAFACRDGRLTWSTLLDGVLRAASALAVRGVRPGDRCAIVLPTGLPFIKAFFGAQALGAVPVAINPKLTVDQIRRRMHEVGCAAAVGDVQGTNDDGADSGAPQVLTRGDLEGAAPLSARTLPRPAPDDLSHLQFTSGTTGSPRAAMLRNSNVTSAVAASRELLDPRPRDLLVGWLPLHHDFGLVRFVFGPVVYGCGCHLVESSIATLPRWLETIAMTRATITAAPDVAFRLAARLVKRDRFDLRSLRVATSGGEPVRLGSIATFEEHFDLPGRVLPAYGLAEATLGVTALREGEQLRVDAMNTVSCGRPMDGVRLRITGLDGRDLPAGASGRVMVSSPGVFAGYWNDPGGTAEVLHDGWLDTGDVGAVDADGHLYVHGRVRAMIKRGAATIAPREIEEAVDLIEGVRRSAAIGLAAGGDSTERVVLVVEADRGVPADALEDVRRSVAEAASRAVGFAPSQVVLVSPGVIPRTATGKTRYDELRRQLQTREIVEI